MRQRAPFPLISLRETARLPPSSEGKIKYFVSQSLQIHCSFQPHLRWKQNTFPARHCHAGSGEATWRFEYRSTDFSPFLFLRAQDLRLRRLCLCQRPWLKDSHTINPKGSPKQRGSALEPRAPPRGGACRPRRRLLEADGRSRVSQPADSVLPLSGAFSQTSTLNYLDHQGIGVPAFAYRSSAFPANHFPRRTLNGQKEAQPCRSHTVEISARKSLL